MILKSGFASYYLATRSGLESVLEVWQPPHSGTATNGLLQGSDLLQKQSTLQVRNFSERRHDTASGCPSKQGAYIIYQPCLLKKVGQKGNKLHVVSATVVYVYIYIYICSRSNPCPRPTMSLGLTISILAQIVSQNGSLDSRHLRGG